MFWHQMVGMGPILLYSNSILEQISTENRAIMTSRQATYLVGLVNMISSATGIFVSHKYSRRFLLIYGHLLMGCSHIAIGLFAYMQIPAGVLSSMLCFIFFF
jgi:hypothetical protein